MDPHWYPHFVRWDKSLLGNGTGLQWQYLYRHKTCSTLEFRLDGTKINGENEASC